MRNILQFINLMKAVQKKSCYSLSQFFQKQPQNPALEGIPDPEKTGWKLGELLSQIEDCTSGERLGIETLLWRARGYSCGEISNLYGIIGKLTRKRIAQTKKKLKKDPELLRALH